MLVSVGERDSTQTAAQLIAAIDELLDVDPDTLADSESAEAVVGLHRQQARLAAVGRRRLPVVWGLGGAPLPPPVNQARGEVWLGRRLRTTPVTALAASDISLRHAMVLASLAGGRTGE
jgi:hypothetical protein